MFSCNYVLGIHPGHLCPFPNPTSVSSLDQSIMFASPGGEMEKSLQVLINS